MHTSIRGGLSWNIIFIASDSIESTRLLWDSDLCHLLINPIAAKGRRQVSYLEQQIIPSNLQASFFRSRTR